ncbi:MAG: tRNA (5-methylaminomethyl-2-thiouridine)(34)-methyltransferase MnmD [Candidatus Azobacteroides sp.]|nr:tRNA (5-methylaminomethyl-2-thiouridine)(34)-methyltransferase MnmD [Candidatus Azobacteroides sp.]
MNPLPEIADPFSRNEEERALLVTADGSHTLFSAELNEHYHSMNGAMQESLHVYIHAGFNLCKKEAIRVLELGFGTGLNAFLTALEAEKRKIKVSYIALEKYPLSPQIIEKLNYSHLNKNLFSAIHAAEWEKDCFINPFFSLQKIKIDFRDYDYLCRPDVVYYDAFAPDKQPEVWSQEIFDALYRTLSAGGILTTYSAKGTVRRMMLQSGFRVERLPGPPGKREMLRATSARSNFLN